MEKNLWTKWPEWEYVKRLGSGSFGSVYKAVRKDLGENIYSAIKVLQIPSEDSIIEQKRADGLSDDEIKTLILNNVKAFTNEIKVMQSLKGISNNIVEIDDFYVAEMQDSLGYYIFIRMELLDSFKSYIEKNPLSPQNIVKIGCDICSALEICHKKGIIHRDMKPENILVNTEMNLFKLGDFGVARKFDSVNDSLTRRTGTPKFMAPEVASYKKYDTSADLYSLGLVLYYLANGKRLPFVPDKQIISIDDEEEALEKRLSGEPIPEPANVSPALADVILKACAFNPKDRFSSAAEMKTALENSLAGYSTAKAKPQQAPPQAPEQEIGSFGPKKKKPKKAIILIIAVILGFSVYYSNSKNDDEIKTSETGDNAIESDAEEEDSSGWWDWFGADEEDDQTNTTSDAEQEPAIIHTTTTTATTTTTDGRWHLFSPEEYESMRRETAATPEETVPVIATTEAEVSKAIGLNTISTTETPREEELPDGSSMDNAIPILTDTCYSIEADSSESGSWSTWYKITTSSNLSNYLFDFKEINGDNYVNYEIYNREYKVIFTRSLNYGNAFISLESDSEYWLKVSSKKPTPYVFSVNECPCDGGRSRETAMPIELNTEYIKSIEIKNSVDWFKFTTTENYAVYRFYFNKKVNDSSASYICYSIFDHKGIKIEEGAEHSGGLNFDLYLEPNAVYYIKTDTGGSNSTGDYKLSVSEIAGDAGFFKEDALPVESETEYTAVLDSTYSDWYVFTPKEDGEYKISIHNIDTGVYINAYIDGTSGSISVNNESSKYTTVKANKEERIYIKFKTDSNEYPNGTYIFEINKVKE